MQVKCKICGTKIDRDTAYKRIVNGKNSYYCAEQEYLDDLSKKAQTKANKDKVYRIICEILGVEHIINTSLYKEWSIWSKVADDEKISQFLEENKNEYTRLIARLNSGEYAKIRYLSAIIKNKIGEYETKVDEKETSNTISIDEGYITKYKLKLTRKSFDDIEDEV